MVLLISYYDAIWCRNVKVNDVKVKVFRYLFVARFDRSSDLTGITCYIKVKVLDIYSKSS